MQRRLMYCVVAFTAIWVGRLEGRPSHADTGALLAHAQLWMPIATEQLDLRLGPDDPHGFAPGQTVECRYSHRPLAGNSPKFECVIEPHDTVKVKYGGDNGEVFAQVAATRLLWALGFGADRAYPTRIICDGCPDFVGGIMRPSGELIVFPALIERKFPAPVVSDGWSWQELDAAASAPRAERDALKLLAVVIQHTDSKPEQQRIVCLDKPHHDTCNHPFLILHDVGQTFGRASRANTTSVSSANLQAWSHTPVFKEAAGGSCTGNLPRSLTGTLDNPVISEAGRAFLAERLSLLSDGQLRDLFSVARFDLRPRDPRDPKSDRATVDEWVEAFKAKRAEVVGTRCA